MLKLYLKMKKVKCKMKLLYHCVACFIVEFKESIRRIGRDRQANQREEGNVAEAGRNAGRRHLPDLQED